MILPLSIPVEPLDAHRCEPFGWMLGKPVSAEGDTPAYVSPSSDFWREHLFDTGARGETEVLWVVYRNREETVASLELHRLTQQAIVPLTGPIIHVVATARNDGEPDLDTLRAFDIPVGKGICMRPNVWHATRVADKEATCLMLTRPSTTYDLVVHLKTGAPACESVIRAVTPVRIRPAHAV
ncbi:ureidoglycolate lyase [Burkholderia pseudomultivorans]|uniref:ureidoglycolate lyase n=1 Tax=Burkholderia pseudomultivorans TaxID=1207504 RepID=UPI002874AA34|nr:ureidoglycolate lyase [Burkholderia pseudomultivorans]MDS0793043.1 ureidoglycolate lyase [Burkholderia pseudomultivorans]